MARGPLAPFLRYLHSRRHAADADAALLARYTADRDDSAFAELVRRHGPLVWRVCRQVLGHDQDAEDAFQATFFLLARGAASVRDGAAVAGWLHGTAWRVAHKARTAAIARRERERHASVREVGDTAAEAALRELQTMLHEEVARLPAKYRTPFVLCVLEGRGRAAVARSLGWNESTLAARLAWARQRLRTRLARRGVDVGAALCAADLARGAAPAALVKATAAAAVSGVAPASVAVLIQGGIATVFTTKVQQLTALALLAAALTAGTAGLHRVGSREAPQPVAQAKAVPGTTVGTPPAQAPEKVTCSFTVTGTATEPDGKPVKGATVALMNGPEAVGTTRTDALGHYEIRNVRLPVQGPNGGFMLQVYATANEMAFAWSPEFVVHAFPEPRFGDDEHFTPVAKVMDITFQPSSHLQGRILDERGQPVIGAKVEIGFIDVLEQKVELEGEENLTATHFTFFNQIVPEKLRSTMTDASGRFRLDRVPRDCFTVLNLTHAHFPDMALYATTAAEPLPDLSRLQIACRPGPQNPVWTSDINLTLVTPRSVPVQVVSDLTGEPVAAAGVGLLQRHGKVQLGAMGTTDAQGQANIRVPPGQFSSWASASERGFVEFQSELTVVPEPRDQPLYRIRLVPGCVLQFEAVDADSGQPLGRIEFQQDADGKPGERTPVRSATGVGSYPARTDDDGKLRVTVAPGKRQIVVKASDYDTVKGPTDPVDLPAGQEVKLRFELRKKGQPPPPPAAAAAPQPTTATIIGTATGPDQMPVKGATIYLLAQAGQLLATTTTDEKGHYEFSGIRVPPPTVGAQPPGARAVIIGIAPGLALERTEILFDAPTKRSDVSFPRPHEFTGRVVDDRGQPVPNVQVRLQMLHYTKVGDLPEALVTTDTKPDGTFRFGGIPQGARAELKVTHPDFATLELAVATPQFQVKRFPFPESVFEKLTAEESRALMNGVQVSYVVTPHWTDNIDVTLLRPRSIPVLIVAAKTGAPLQDVQVALGAGEDKTRMISRGMTDAAGRTMLRMPPGEYPFHIRPPPGTDYLPIADTMTVAATPAEQPQTVRMQSGCAVEIVVVDADTGFPIRHVTFETYEQNPAPGFSTGWKTVNDATGYKPSVDTDKWGKLTVVVPPGRRAIRPAMRFVAVSEIKPIELPAGGTVKLRFLVRERE